MNHSARVPIFVLSAIMLGSLTLSCGQGGVEGDLVQPDNWWDVHPRPVYASLEKVGTYQEWFDVYRLTEGTYAIYEPNQFEEAISYLVLGEDRGVLVDTGNGIGDLRAVVEELTDLPVSVVLTHEHYDHVAGAWQYDEITAYDNAASLAAMQRGRDHASMERYLVPDYLWKPLPVGFDPDTWHIPSLVPTVLVTDGDVIDLGGRTLEVIYTPGHSPGQMCLLDPDHRFLISGDHFFPGPLYAYSADVDLDAYIASNAKLVERLDEFDWLLPGHNEPWVRSSVLKRVGKAFETVLKGRGRYSENEGLSRYYFKGFDILIMADAIE